MIRATLQRIIVYLEIGQEGPTKIVSGYPALNMDSNTVPPERVNRCPVSEDVQNLVRLEACSKA